MISGMGVYTYANGEKYIGEFKNGKKHGHGVCVYARGDEKTYTCLLGNHHVRVVINIHIYIYTHTPTHIDR